MRIPFFSPKEPEDLKGIASRVTYIPSHMAAGPRGLKSTRTLEDNRAAAKRIRRILNGGHSPS